MASNIDVTPGSGKTVATDDVGGFQHQIIKVRFGGTGVANDWSAGAGAVGTGTPRMTLASDDPAVTQLTAIAASAADTTTPVNVTGYLNTIAVGPTTISTAYTANWVVGGLLTFTSLLRANGKTAYAVSARVVTKVANTGQFDLLIFNANPTASTTTDGGAFVLNAADMPKLKGVIPILTTDWVAAGTAAAVGYKEARVPLVGAAGADIYAVLITRAGITLGSTTGVLVELSADQN